MPFVKKNDSRGSPPPTDARNLFIGRTSELLFFVQNILTPEEPTHNIISISGQGGVGKSTLLARFIDETRTADFHDSCLTALVDERRTTLLSMMEHFAHQLQITGKFEKALKQYKEMVRTLQTEQETLQDTVLRSVPDFAGAAVEGIPLAGPLLREGVKVTARHLLDRYHTVQVRGGTAIVVDPVAELTRAFVAELNRLTDTQVTLSLPGGKRRQRVLLFFDTFEQLADQAVPWLLDDFLEADISTRVVLVVAGRDPLEHATPDTLKRWLPYYEGHTIYSISLSSFTEDETRAYLTERGITDPARMHTIWQLSRGLPLYLGILTANPLGKVDPMKDVIDNFLRWIPEREHVKRRLAVDAALFSRSFNQDDLQAFTYLPEGEWPGLYRWLIGLSFVRGSSQDGQYTYHELARELFSRHLFQHSKNEYYATRRALAGYYRRQLEQILLEAGTMAYRSAEWLELVLALTSQLFSLPDEASHCDGIELVLDAFAHTSTEQEDGEIMRVLRELSREQPTNQVSPGARQTVQQLLRYAEAGGWRNVERLAAANDLLENVLHKTACSSRLLAALYCIRGSSYSSLEDQQALADFDRALELDPDSATAYTRRGFAYLKLESYQRAIQDFDRALELAPAMTDAYHGRGRAYYRLKEHQRALADLDRILELHPDAASAYSSRGWAYSELGSYQQAIQDFDRALELAPAMTDAYNGRGWAYRRLKEYQRALADFDRILELDPSHYAAYNGRGHIYREQKEYQRALVEFEQMIKLNPRSPWPYYNRGWIYYGLKSYQRAIEDFDYALTLGPTHVLAYFRRGLSFLWLQDLKQARADFTRSWELHPADIHRGWMAEWSRMCLEKPDAAVPERLETMAAMAPQHTAAHICQGVALYLRGCFAEAMRAFEQATSSGPEEWDPYFWTSFWKGMVCASLRQDEEAMTAVEQSLELELPPVLLAPLRWLEQERPDFYEQCVVPLLARYK